MAYYNYNSLAVYKLLNTNSRRSSSADLPGQNPACTSYGSLVLVSFEFILKNVLERMF